MDVDAVKQRSGDLAHVALNHGLGAVALAGAVIKVAAGTGIHRGRQHEARREGQGHRRPSDADSAILQRLPHDLQNVAREFG